MTTTDDAASGPSIADRRHDLDWIRVIAVVVLILYHVAISFQPWGAEVFFITNDESLGALRPLMALANVWRIPLLFVVAGMSATFLIRHRGWTDLLKDRTLRILLPFVFGCFVICPIHAWLYLRWSGAEPHYMPRLGHLWFLGNLFVYALLLPPLARLMRSQVGQRLTHWVVDMLRQPACLYVVVLPVALEAWLVNPRLFSLYAGTMHGFLLGLLCFLLGAALVGLGERFWAAAERLRWASLILASVLFLIRLAAPVSIGINPRTGIESALWILAIIGFAAHHLNRPSDILSRLGTAAYPVYIVHIAVQYAIASVLFPTALPAGIKYLILATGTLLGSYTLHEGIRRLKWLRPLFGMKG